MRRHLAPSDQLWLPGVASRDRSSWKQLPPEYVLRTRWQEDPATAPPVPRWWSPSPEALAVVESFHCRRTQHFIRRWVATDPTGRLAQLAAAHPGVLILTTALEQAGNWPAARRVVRQVQAGTRLRTILRDNVHACCEARLWKVDGWQAPLVCETECSPERHEARVRLVQRAGPWVAPLDLIAPLPRHFVETDIPRDPEPNAAWFRMVAQRLPPLTVPRDVEESVCLFVSRHALELDRNVGWRVVGKLFEYCTLTGRRPSRKTSPSRLLAELTEWRLRRKRDAAIQVACPRFPSPPLPRFERGPVAIVPIESSSELVEEGRALSHCVARLTKLVALGRAYFYSVRVGNLRSTLEVRLCDGEWMPHEQRGRFNAKPSTAELDPVVTWLRAAWAER